MVSNSTQPQEQDNGRNAHNRIETGTSHGPGFRRTGELKPISAVAENDLFQQPVADGHSDDWLAGLHTLLRWKGTILSVFIVAAIASLAIIRTSIEPQYGSTAVIRIASNIPRVLYKTEDNGTVPLFQSYLNTQVSVMQSHEVLSRVIERDDVKATHWYQSAVEGGASPTRLIDRLSRQLAVTVRRGTELVDMTIETDDPDESAVLVNAAAESYCRYWDALQIENEHRRLSALRKQLDDVQSDINTLFEKKHSLSARMGTELHQEVRTRLLTELNSRKAALSLLRQERRVRAMDAAGSNVSASEAVPATADSARLVIQDVLDDIRLDRVPPEVQADASWLRHQEEFVSAKKRLDLMRRQFGESHPALQSAMADLEQARRMLRLTEQRMGLTALDSTETTGSPDHREEVLSNSIAELEAQLASSEALAQEIARTEEQYDESKAMRKELMDRLNALETESNAPARVSIQSAGVVRAQPSTDRRMLLSACALLASGLLALGVGYVRGRIDPKIHELSDIQSDATMGTPFLGQLPHARDVLNLGDDTLLGQAVNENIRIIRTMLLHRLGGHGGAVAVTSPEANSGKTTIAVMLARSLAVIGRRVLLVDVDLIHPSVTRHFDAARGPGLRCVLTNRARDDEAIISTDIAGLDVLPVGKRVGSDDNDVLAQGGFSASLQRWRSAYDIVLLDSPPVLSMANARIAAANSDGAIMVLRSSGSNRDDALEAYAGLSAAGARLLGSVLVGVHGGSAYYPYNYCRQYLETEVLLA
ncbi:MAG: AAA family ATPase [Phycisphaerae bacterium]|nr:AAA family ATPase [Phycisphaerae bacterium]